VFMLSCRIYDTKIKGRGEGVYVVMSYLRHKNKGEGGVYVVMSYLRHKVMVAILNLFAEKVNVRFRLKGRKRQRVGLCVTERERQSLYVTGGERERERERERFCVSIGRVV